jgi:DNA processing protein
MRALLKREIEMMGEKAYWVGWQRVDGVGAVSLQKLIGHLGSLKKAWQAPIAELTEVLGEKTVKRFQAHREESDPDDYYTWLSDQGVAVLVLGIDESYPKLLLDIKRPPPVLYVRGELTKEDEKSVAVVGTRKPTDYGVALTKQFCRGMVRAKVTIVSGLARGIDGIAHQSALEAGGRTVAVLGNGILSLYPPEHERLGQRIIENGAIISTFAPEEPGLPRNFAVRNRYIAGLSLGVLVTEGAEKSGTKITADEAIKQGRPVFAIPGDITRPMSQAPLQLIKEGAVPVSSAQEIVEYLSIRAERSEAKIHFDTILFRSAEQELLWQALGDQEKSIDELVRQTGLPVQRVSVELMMMEMEQWLQVVAGKYRKNRVRQLAEVE